MICDALMQFDPTGTAVTVTAASTNTIDLSQDRDLGETDLDLVVTVQETFTAAGAATLTVEWQTSSDNATWVTLVKSRAYALPELTAGAEIFPADIPYGTKRYNRLVYTVDTGPMTAGKVQAQLVVDRARPLAYAAGTDVSAI